MNMQIFSVTMIGLILFAAWYYQDMRGAPQQSPVIGLAEFVYEDVSRIFENKPRTLEVAVWYPVEQDAPKQKIEFGIWKIKDASRNAPIANGRKHPLIIFSHGYSANQWVNTWFAEFFAENGYIVAVVRHYGNSYHNMIPELCARPWNRPLDMSFILDRLLEQPEFKDHIDFDRIGAAGFSQGGVSCFWLAGAQAELSPEMLKRQITVVNEPALRMIHFKDISEDRLEKVLENFTFEDFERANRCYRDERFKAAFVISPGIDDENHMFTMQGLAQVSIPIYITIGAADTDLLEQAAFFAKHIPKCSFTLIPGQVTHMTMLNEGTESGKVRKPAYTLDHVSIDRAAVHRSVAKQALHFFDSHLL